MRSSTRLCCAVCGSGLNSPFETIWVGTGALNAARSAGSVRDNSDLLSNRAIDILPQLLRGVAFEGWAGRTRTHRAGMVSGIVPRPAMLSSASLGDRKSVV